MAGVTRAPGGRIYEKNSDFPMAGVTRAPGGRIYENSSDFPMAGVTRAPGGRIYEKNSDLQWPESPGRPINITNLNASTTKLPFGPFIIGTN